MALGTHQLKFGGDFRLLSPTVGAPSYILVVIAPTYAQLQAGIANVGTGTEATITTVCITPWARTGRHPTMAYTIHKFRAAHRRRLADHPQDSAPRRIRSLL
jgi:hypothetical protein